MKKLSPLSYDWVDMKTKMKGLSLMTPVEYKHHVNIAEADLFLNIFVLVILLGAVAYLLLGGQNHEYELDQMDSRRLYLHYDYGRWTDEDVFVLL